MISVKKYKLLLDELDNGNHEYSFFRLIVESSRPDPRVLIQIKCIEKLKWELSESLNTDISWKEVKRLWVEEGFAEAFAKAYDTLYDPDNPSCFCMIYQETLKNK